MSKKSGVPGLSFSWKRATDITNVKRKIAKATGIPTKQGRRNKFAKLFGIKYETASVPTGSSSWNHTGKPDTIHR